MLARLTNIDPTEALRYLGARGDVSEELRAELDAARSLLMRTARPRLVWRELERQADGSLTGTGWTPPGEDISALLSDCARVAIFAATMGAEIELLLRRAQRRDMAEALLLDACAATAIENVCDNFCADLASEAAPLKLTMRYSPGYGDFPLDEQRRILALLDAERRIGLSLTPGGLMLPQKSVTAIIGLREAADQGPTREGQAPPLQAGDPALPALADPCARCPKRDACPDRPCLSARRGL